VPLSLVLLWRGDLAPDRLYAQNWLSWRMLTFSAGYFVYDVYVHTLRFEYAAGLAHAVGACAVFCVGTALGIQHFYGAPAAPPAARGAAGERVRGRQRASEGGRGGRTRDCMRGRAMGPFGRAVARLCSREGAAAGVWAFRCRAHARSPGAPRSPGAAR
jgi:hypothetical protein